MEQLLPINSGKRCMHSDISSRHYVTLPSLPKLEVFGIVRVSFHGACRRFRFASATTFVVCGHRNESMKLAKVSNGPVKSSLRVVYVGCQTHRNIASPELLESIPSW